MAPDARSEGSIQRAGVLVIGLSILAGVVAGFPFYTYFFFLGGLALFTIGAFAGGDGE